MRITFRRCSLNKKKNKNKYEEREERIPFMIYSRKLQKNSIQNNLELYEVEIQLHELEEEPLR